ncbi:hypothetical protein E0493_19750 [Roseomonas sp. M0104]|uniref:Uncharacterized protein n=1 Tax=Teichococcus coralli TaxID=2545983 RepID=A0A845BHG9_9PROT|nr:hypothetical protein [Pseudoroseomonas coralli]MXP65586.1 hypothetical protein [Pseudoroseomonas coralli]
MSSEKALSPVSPVAAPAEREAGAGYAAAARALSALPPLGEADGPLQPAAHPRLDAAALRRAGLEALLPGGPAGLVLPLALAMLRPDVRRWLGAGRLQALAELLGQPPQETAAVLDTPPLPPATLGDPSRWSGRQVPLLTPEGGLAWLDLFWRPDQARRQRLRDRHVLAARLDLPASGRVEIRARMEDARLDAVLETTRALPRVVAADLSDAFAALLQRLRLQGSLTVRHTQQDRGT